MLWMKSFHMIAVITWFAGLFYLPRLFVYHAEATDAISLARFKVMEHRLYYAITWPSAVVATFLGECLAWGYLPTSVRTAPWMHLKVALVVLVWGYHFACGHYLKKFKQDQNTHSSLFFRVFNEYPTVLLIAIVILVVVKPQF